MSQAESPIPILHNHWGTTRTGACLYQRPAPHDDLKLQVAQEDTGRVVGKHGRIATAMRSVLEVITARGKPVG